MNEETIIVKEKLKKADSMTMLGREAFLRENNTMETCSGKIISLLDPDPTQIIIPDICQGLAFNCRFSGQIPWYYSVAEHTILVASLAPAHLKPAAMVHDMPEAYLNDIISPLKSLLPGYKEIEKIFERAICERFGIRADHLMEIKQYDRMAFEIEYRCIQSARKQGLSVLELAQPNWEVTVEDPDNEAQNIRVGIKFYDPYKAYTVFLNYLKHYFPDPKLYV